MINCKKRKKDLFTAFPVVVAVSVVPGAPLVFGAAAFVVAVAVQAGTV